MSRFDQRTRQFEESEEYRAGAAEAQIEFDLAQALEGARKERHLSKAGLADRMGLKRPFVSRKLNHPEDMEFSTFATFLRGLDKRAEIVIRDADPSVPTLVVTAEREG